MLKRLVTKVLGTRFERELKRVQPIVDAIQRHEARVKGLPDAEVQAQTQRFRALLEQRTGALAREVARLKQAKHDCPDADERLKLDGELTAAEAQLARETEACLNDILPEAFATVREASRPGRSTRRQPMGWRSTGSSTSNPAVRPTMSAPGPRAGSSGR